MQLREPRLWLVDDPEDAPATTRALHALADLDGGVVVVRVTPGPRLLHAIATDLLRALGKDHDRNGAIRNGEESWRRATAWLAAEGVEHLIVDRAESMQPDRWQDFIGLASHCGLSLWLIAHGASLNRAQREMLDDWPIGRMRFEHFLAQHTLQARTRGGSQREEQPGADTPVPEPFPALPRSDFTTFRADCRQLLAPGTFQRVEAELQAGAELTRQWLAGAHTPDAATMKEHLRELIEDCSSIGQALARLRAAQAICLTAGLLVTVDLERLAGSTRTIRPAVDAQLLALLRAYSDTHLATIALLACLTGASPETMSRMNLRDVTADTLEVGGQPFRVPEIVRCVLAAHIYRRLAAGALPHNALFADNHKGQLGDRSTARAIRTAINKMSRSSGLILWGENSSREDTSKQHWLHRRGVSVQVLR